MKTLDTLIIGAGQAGLAMSVCLQRAGVDHAVVERGRMAERWRSERWESFRLLTPNWFARLPGQSYGGGDPDGYMTAPETVRYLSRYAAGHALPVFEDAPATRLRRAVGAYEILGPAGAMRARSVVIATGACAMPAIPAHRLRLAPRICQLHSRDYRSPSALPEGGVLVVGASASGLQIARELNAAGRDVTLAVGRHTRVPRRYRGVDIVALMDRAGILSETTNMVPDLERARRQPSLQLTGDTRPFDLAAMRDAGIRVLGRLAAIEGTKARFAGDLYDSMDAADLRLRRLLLRLDACAQDLPAENEAAMPIAFHADATEIDLVAAGIATLVWATGFREAYPWLDISVTDGEGRLRHTGGVTPSPGLFALGMPFLRRRKSTFIDGVGDDAAALVDPIKSFLARRQRALA